MIARLLLSVLLLAWFVWLCSRAVAFLRRAFGLSSGVPLDGDPPDD